jgi:CRP-like cAMP-binding protein
MEIGRPYSRLLQRLERYGALEPHERQRISELPLIVTNVSANQAITHQGDKPLHCTLVLDGFLYTHKIASRARRQITSFVIPGDFADPGPLSSQYRLQSLRTWACGRRFPATRRIERHAGPVATARSGILARNLHRSGDFREWVTNLGRRESIARVAHLICELAARLQTVDLARNLCLPFR